jgi:hypothetical protein
MLISRAAREINKKNSAQWWPFLDDGIKCMLGQFVLTSYPCFISLILADLITVSAHVQ